MKTLHYARKYHPYHNYSWVINPYKLNQKVLPSSIVSYLIVDCLCDWGMICFTNGWYSWCIDQTNLVHIFASFSAAKSWTAVAHLLEMFSWLMVRQGAYILRFGWNASYPEITQRWNNYFMLLGLWKLKVNIYTFRFFCIDCISVLFLQTLNDETAELQKTFFYRKKVNKLCFFSIAIPNFDLVNKCYYLRIV